MRAHIGLWAMAALAASGGAHATTFTGSATGSWSNPSATGAVYTIANNDNTAGTNGLASFDFGTPGSANNTSNLLTFNGVGTVGNTTPFTTMENSPFVLGDFSYRNGTTSASSYPGGTSSVGLGINLALSQPTGVPTSMFSYSISLNITDNTTGNAVLDADTATIVAGTTSRTFTTGGQTYTLALLGFSTNNGATFTNTFVAPEETTSTARLYATITTNTLPTNVPEPVSLAVLGAGLLGVGFVRQAGRSRLSAG